jgi:hypothetical protein
MVAILVFFRFLFLFVIIIILIVVIISIFLLVAPAPTTVRSAPVVHRGGQIWRVRKKKRRTRRTGNPLSSTLSPSPPSLSS